MLSNHLILCHPLHLLPSVFPSIRVFYNEVALHIRWPKYWSFNVNISPSNEYSGLIFIGLTGLICWQSMGLSRVFSNTTVQKHHFFSAQPFYGPRDYYYLRIRIIFIVLFELLQTPEYGFHVPEYLIV